MRAWSLLKHTLPPRSENVSFLTLKTEEPPGPEEDGGEQLSPVPTLESVVSLVTANTTDATVAALAAVQAAAESTIKSELVLFTLLCTYNRITHKLFQLQCHQSVISLTQVRLVKMAVSLLTLAHRELQLCSLVSSTTPGQTTIV